MQKIDGTNNEPLDSNELTESQIEMLKQDMQEEQFMRQEPEQYVMQTLDDAALVLTVCKLSLEQMNSMLPSQIRNVEYRVQHLREMLDTIDNKVAQWYTYGSVDSSLEGN